MARLTSVEHKAIYTDFIVSLNADLINKALFVSQSTQSGHQPAITISTLTDISGGGAIYVELWVFENVLAFMSNVTA
jgi:hypothetical protein